jgi:hypothetical protein
MTKLMLSLSLLLLVVGCATKPYHGSMLCTDKQYAMYEDAGMPWESCDKDKQMFHYYVFRGKTWKDLDKQFTKFIRPRLKRIKKAVKQ